MSIYVNIKYWNLVLIWIENNRVDFKGVNCSVLSTFFLHNLLSGYKFFQRIRGFKNKIPIVCILSNKMNFTHKISLNEIKIMRNYLNLTLQNYFRPLDNVFFEKFTQRNFYDLKSVLHNVLNYFNISMNIMLCFIRLYRKWLVEISSMMWKNNSYYEDTINYDDV